MRTFLSTVLAWLTGPRMQRFVFAVLRRFAPVLVIGKRVLITQHADVLDVLKRDEDFTIKKINAPRLDGIQVHFILGMDRSLEYDREEALLESVVLKKDLDRIQKFARVTADGLIEAASTQGRIDVVTGLARVVPMRLIENYFGVPSPNDQTMMHWMRILFQEIFLNFSNDPEVHETALRAATELKHHIEMAIVETKARSADGISRDNETVLSRLLAVQKQNSNWPDDDTVRRSISGLMLGSAETTSKAFTHVIDELLSRPDQLRGAVAAATLGGVEMVGRYAFEALRFDPVSPVLLRYCPRETLLGAGEVHKRTIPANSTVAVSPLSAMFDPSVFEKPSHFDADRKSNYLHFGYGMHTCFGRWIVGVEVPELVMAILKLKNLRRAPGSEGRIVYEGAFPDRLILEFDP